MGKQLRWVKFSSLYNEIIVVNIITDHPIFPIADLGNGINRPDVSKSILSHRS